MIVYTLSAFIAFIHQKELMGEQDITLREEKRQASHTAEGMLAEE